MSSIDERIVEMKFDGAQFVAGADQAIDKLDALKKSLELGETESSVEANVASIASKISIFGALAFTAVQKLADGAIGFGEQIAGAILDPLIEGGKKRALNIEQAKFQFKGLGMDVQSAMDSALYAVQGTAFGLDEAAVAASQFGASGVAAGSEMDNALRGISGVAAMAGSSYSDIARVFTKVSGQGRLMGDDLNSLGARGINAAATLAEAFGTTESDIRDMVSEGKISFKDFSEAMSNAFGEHATKANETFTGSLSNMRAALSRIGASRATADFEEQRKLFNALTPKIDAVHNALKPLINVYNELSGISNDNLVKFIEGIDLAPLGEAMLHIADGARQAFRFLLEVLQPVKDAFATVFPDSALKSLPAIAQAIQAFTYSLTVGEGAANGLQRTFQGLFAIFDIGFMIVKGLLGVLWDLLGAIFEGSGTVLDMTGNMGDFIMSIRDAMKNGTGLTTFFQTMSEVLTVPINLIKLLAGGIGALWQGLKTMDFSGINTFFGEFGRVLGDVGSAIGERLSVFKDLAPILSGVWDVALTAMKGFVNYFAPGWKIIGDAFGSLGTFLGDSVSNTDWSLALDGINTGLLAGIAFLIKKFLDGGFGGVDMNTGLVDTIKETFGSVTATFEAMQNQLKAKTLMSIAIAIAIMTASVIALSFIDSERLTSAMFGLSVMVALIMGSLSYMSKSLDPKALANLPVVAAGMILMATALVILSAAVTILAKLDWNELARGLVGVVVLLGAMVGVVKLMQGMEGSLFATGLGMILLGAALKILVSAVSDLAGMTWEEMIRGLVGVSALLGVIGAFAKFAVGPKLIASSISLVILGAALKLLASAMGDIADMTGDQLVTGLVGMSAALAIVAGTMNLMPKGMILSAAGLVAVGFAMGLLTDSLVKLGDMKGDEMVRSLIMLAGGLAILAGALYLMTGTIVGAAALTVASVALMLLVPALVTLGDMEWDNIGRGLVMLAGSLVILAAGLYLMTAALPGAAALLVASAALTLLVPVMVALGAMSWEAVGTGLGILAATLGILALAGIALIPALPGLIGLGLAVTLLGIGAMAAGIGIGMFALGLAALATAGPLAGEALTAVLVSLVGIIPAIFVAIGEGLIAMAGVIEQAAPALVSAIVAVLQALIDGINTIAPQIIDMIWGLVMKLIETITTNLPLIVDAGLQMITAILNGIASNIEGIVTAATNIIVNFINGIANNLPRIVQAGINLIITFVESLAQGVRDNTERMNRAGLDLASAIIEGMTSGISGGIDLVINAVKDMAGSALSAAATALGINSPSKKFAELAMWSAKGFGQGFDKNKSVAAVAAEGMAKTALSSMREAMAAIPDLLASDMDLSPTIRPVVDLSDVSRNAALVDGMFGNADINAGNAGSQASVINQNRSDSAEASAESSGDSTNVTNVEFKQYNTSPKAISEIEVYRNTKNAVASITGVVNNADAYSGSEPR